jgi:hypothetical protein
MKITTKQLITAFIGLGAILDTAYSVLTENASVLTDLGVNPKLISIVKLSGMVYAIFSASLLNKNNEK